MRYAHCLFCDDVRTEMGDKLSVMGIYGGELVATRPEALLPVGEGAPAALLPRLCIVGYAFTPIDRPFERLSFTVLRNDEVIQQQDLDPSELARMADRLKGIGSPEDPVTMFQVVVNLSLSPYIISDAHTLSLRFNTESEELIAGKLRVRFNKP
ncbi:hypothetical protein BBB39_12925 [Bordetella trematum]|uniref:Uncharacterized protein n=2 Tax=Bordetella trematum TaxID=123899 RepID=A0A157SV65_9BORD|nr:hypothetical protein [Bordetella trematum]AZR94579.1 hypothetical protein BBB39_12925 [Bordetella trematum]NNH19151.1 hypothetical protein [Bordetella trematum]CZZ83805.1 Uncharacterised protein [Bordetella trematum]SAI73816.1 Uncharacterised protein [Bordetella trematum]SUV97183.1 Uncharacterised protein [Bordetella trematum]